MLKKLLFYALFFCVTKAFAATPIDLSKETSMRLFKNTNNLPSLKETMRAQDHNQTQHVRLQQYYQETPILGAVAIFHLHDVKSKQTEMNGTIYKDIEHDLHYAAKDIFTLANENKAKEIALEFVKDQDAIIQQVNQLVYIDEHHLAHWAYQINLLQKHHDLKRKPTVIIDVETGTIYEAWNTIKTYKTVTAGGFSGNHKTGQKELDGGTGHLPAFKVQRDDAKRICLMKNANITINDYRSDKTMAFSCVEPDASHNNVYWNANHDQVETTWSPSNDVMFGLEVSRRMYQDWYHMPVLIKKNKAMHIKAVVHDSIENAYWDDNVATFGDSIKSKDFNPFTQLDTVVHELSHGFTEQHSDLQYRGQSGGLNESFSDMAGIAAEYFTYGKTDFLIGIGDMKAAGKAMRYMEEPSKDCAGTEPGNYCSISHMSQYDYLVKMAKTHTYSEFDKQSYIVHFASGIFNRVYYLLANSPGFNAKKAFDVMVQANRFYWTSTTTFSQAACGVLKAATDYQYDTAAVKEAFNTVGITTTTC